jgi:uracil phosphoribosyltransferase
MILKLSPNVRCAVVFFDSGVCYNEKNEGGERNMLTVIEHPLIRHKLTVMRDRNTGTKDFRDNLDEIGGLMVYEVTRDLPLKDVEIDTPICHYTAKTLATPIVVAPILRAGLGMVSGIQSLIPTAKVAHIGLYRDEETLEPHTYFEKYPKHMDESTVIIVDPMLATGGSSAAAIDMVKKQGATNIKLVCLVGAPEGVKLIEELHPDVDIYLAALDDHLNENGYIVPGLGDAGDRIFGTK